MVGQVRGFRSADFPLSPFFMFELELDNGKTITVQGGPEAATMRLPKALAPINRLSALLPTLKGEAIQISPQHRSAMPLYEGERVMIVGIWNGETLIAERVDLFRDEAAVTWYYRSLLSADELTMQTVNLFKNMEVYVRVQGKDVPKLAPEVDAKIMSSYKSRLVLVKGTLAVNRTWHLEDVQVYIRQITGTYKRIYPAESSGGLAPAPIWRWDLDAAPDA